MQTCGGHLGGLATINPLLPAAALSCTFIGQFERFFAAAAAAANRHLSDKFVLRSGADQPSQGTTIRPQKGLQTTNGLTPHSTLAFLVGATRVSLLHTLHLLATRIYVC